MVSVRDRIFEFGCIPRQRSAPSRIRSSECNPWLRRVVAVLVGRGVRVLPRPARLLFVRGVSYRNYVYSFIAVTGPFAHRLIDLYLAQRLTVIALHTLKRAAVWIATPDDQAAEAHQGVTRGRHRLDRLVIVAAHAPPLVESEDPETPAVTSCPVGLESPASHKA